MAGGARIRQRKHMGDALFPELAKRVTIPLPNSNLQLLLQKAPSADGVSLSSTRLVQSSEIGIADVAVCRIAAVPASAHESSAGLRRATSGAHLWVRPALKFLHPRKRKSNAAGDI